MKNATTAQRLKQLMDAKGLRQVDILKAAEPFCAHYGVKLNKNDLSQYVSGKVEPGQDKLTILGLALGVSEAWLMGFDVSMERSVTPTADVSDGRTKEYIELFELLTAEQQALILHAIKGLLAG
ncbi:MAG: transcriptional regulator [Clostridia bacterium]|nr:transcriptional regulator [Clostridia bacterium]MBR6653238.1 transcriptional regulator [Oscillospiraceae bacterium]